MANDYTQLNVGSGGDIVDEEAVTYGQAPTTRKRPRVVIGGDQAEQLADVTNSTPNATDYGLVTRNIGTQEATLTDIYAALKQIFNVLSRPMWLDPSTGRLNIANLTTCATVTTCSTCTTVTNLGTFGATLNHTYPLERINWQQNVRSRIS